MRDGSPFGEPRPKRYTCEEDVGVATTYTVCADVYGLLNENVVPVLGNTTPFPLDVGDPDAVAFAPFPDLSFQVVTTDAPELNIILLVSAPSNHRVNPVIDCGEKATGIWMWCHLGLTLLH